MDQSVRVEDDRTWSVVSGLVEIPGGRGCSFVLYDTEGQAGWEQPREIQANSLVEPSSLSEWCRSVPRVSILSVP
jgi:hypothetical protein